jgi:hypothetical protein
VALVRLANLALRFLLELGGLAAAGYSAYQLAGGAGPIHWLDAAIAIAAIAILWSLVVAPKTANGLSQPHKNVIGTIVLVLAAAGLALAGQVAAAFGFGGLVIANAAFLIVLGDATRQIARVA